MEYDVLQLTAFNRKKSRMNVSKAERYQKNETKGGNLKKKSY